MTHHNPSHPRLNYLDLSLISRVLTGREGNRREFLDNERLRTHKLPQTSYSLAVFDSQDIGLYMYALGVPLSEVRSYLDEAARWMERVFELRGISSSFPVTVVTLDPNSQSGKQHVLGSQPLHSSDEKDYSLTNSWRGLQGMHLALIVGDLERAHHIAEMVWDPPNASYIGTDSEVCTPDQQHLAYALKQLILGDNQASLNEVSLISIKPIVEVKIQATMVRAIAAKQSNVLLSSLTELLAWHQKMALRKSNLNDPEFFLSIAGLGLCALALRRGLVRHEQLPHDNVYLPVNLLQ